MVNITGTGGNNTLTGSIFDDVISGLGGDDTLRGLAGADTLYGGDGNDKLDGGTGADIMVGGAGNDTYTVDDINDIVDETDGSGHDAGGTDLINASVSYTLSAFVENLTLTGTANLDGTGNALANKITGNSGANVLHGGDGNDTLTGNDGADSLYGDGGDDTLSGGTGNDLLYGGDGKDKLDGGAGADIMVGGAGDDTYTVDDSGDVVDESNGSGGDAGGTDLVNASVSFTLSAFVENLTLTGSSDIDGTGNALANKITGNNGANVLHGGDGNDTLTGNGGADTLYGEGGDDTLAGGDGNDALYGGDGNDKLDGGAGADALAGGAGNDTYIVDNAGDTVDETDGSGHDLGGLDLVNASVSFTLGLYQENLTLTGSLGIDGAGNALDNKLTGNSGDNILKGGDGADTLSAGSGNDTLIGGAGKDTLTGGSGSDLFVFGPADAGSTDKITDFGSGDAVAVEAADYGLTQGHGLIGGLLDPAWFATISGSTNQAKAAGHGQFLYNNTSRTLLWDADGAGGAAGVALATFNSGISLSALSFVVLDPIAVNHGPTAPVTNSVSTSEDTATAAITIGASDVDGDVLNYSVKAGSAPALGAVSFDQAAGTFVYTPAANANGPDGFTILISDGHGGATEQAVSISIAPVNDAPSAPSTGSVSTSRNVATSPIAIGASDVDGDVLAYALKSGAEPGHGSVSFNQLAGTFTYTPTSGYSGADGFTLTVTDPGGLSVEQVVSVAISADNAAPTAPASRNIATDEDTASAPIAIGASDPDGDTLSYSVKAGSAPALGTVSFDQAAGTFVYTPNANANGSDGFTILVSDGHGGTTDQVVSVAVAPVNDAPAAPATGSVSINEDTASAPLAIGASDVDGDVLSYSVKAGSAPALGSVSFDQAAGTFVYTPNANANGSDGFTILISDGHGGATEQAVAVAIAPVNDAPAAPSTNSISTDEDIATAPVAIGASDVDGDALSYAVKAGSAPALGSVAFDQAAGTFVYTPGANANGSDGFTILISDGHGGTIEQAVAVTIAPVNDAPAAPASGSVSTLKNVASSAIAIGASDVDGDVLAYALKSGAGPSHGSVSFDQLAGTFIYTPTSEYSGADAFTITVSDPGGLSVEQIVSVAISATNAAPTAPASSSVSTNEDTASTAKAIGASDPDGDTLSYSVKAGSAPSLGTVSFDQAAGTFIYTPNANANGADGFTILVSDGHGATAQQAVSVSIAAVNDAPSAPSTSSVSTSQNVATAPIAIGASDVDGDVLAYALKSGAAPSHGTVSFDQAAGTFTYAPSASYSGTDAFTLTVTDSGGLSVEQLVSVAISGVNAAPAAPASKSVAINEDTPSTTISIGASDPDGDTLSYSVKSGAAPIHGSVSFNQAAGTFVYTPTANANGSDGFTVLVSDGHGGTAEQVVSVTIAPVNDAPTVASSTNYVTTYQNVATAPVAIGASDVDGDVLTYLMKPGAGPAHGSVTFDQANATFTYTSTGSFTGEDTFTLRAKDPSGLYVNETIWVTVNPTSSGVPTVEHIHDLRGIGSPDPTGIAYIASSQTLFVADAEADETFFHGTHNLWGLSTDGTLQTPASQYDLISTFSHEDTGLSYDPVTNHLFITDDDQHMLFWVDPANPTVKLGEFPLGGIGGTDIEDVAFDPNNGHLFMINGSSHTLIETTTDGALVSSVVLPVTIKDPEGLAYDAANDVFYVGGKFSPNIWTVDHSGKILGGIDLGAFTNPVSGAKPGPSDFVLAPSSDPNDDPAKMSLYVTDTGTWHVNDGRLFEINLVGNGHSVSPDGYS